MASLEAHWRFYSCATQGGGAAGLAEPVRPGQERISFSSIVCALDEADAIGATLAGLIEQSHRRHQVVVSLRAHDTPTITAVRRFQRAHPGAIDVVLGHYDVPGKHAQLNGACRTAPGTISGRSTARTTSRPSCSST